MLRVNQRILVTELFPDIQIDVMGNALRIGQEEGDIWVDLSDVPQLLEIIKEAVNEAILGE